MRLEIYREGPWIVVKDYSREVKKGIRGQPHGPNTRYYPGGTLLQIDTTTKTVIEVK